MDKLHQARNFGYLRLDSIDLNEWKAGFLQKSSPLWIFGFIFLNHVLTFWLFVWFLVEVAVLIYLLPYIGIGDQLYPLTMKFEYALPQGFLQWMYVAALGSLLFMKVAVNFVVRGIMAQKDITLGKVMTNRYAKRLICLKSYTKWRLFRHLLEQCTTQEYIISWTLYFADEWKRFLVFKSVVLLVASVQLHETLTRTYISRDPIIKSVACAYWSIKIALISIEAIGKAAAGISYLAYLRNITEIKNGCTLSDYWQNRIVERAAPLITLKNPFLEAATPGPSDKFDTYHGSSMRWARVDPNLQRPVPSVHPISFVDSPLESEYRASRWSRGVSYYSDVDLNSFKYEY